MNGFSNNGAYALGKAMAINDVLEQLDISNNRIFTPGAEEFARTALKKNTSLCLVKVSFC